jgi:hypothetical protein
MRPDAPKDWATIIALVTLFASVVASWVVLREAVDNLQKGVVTQRETDRAQDDRLRAIENSRTLEMQIGGLKSDVAALKATVDGMRDDMRAKRR